jgi:DNA-directed RNA polymerase subunit RPC12/RpoP
VAGPGRRPPYNPDVAANEVHCPQCGGVLQPDEGQQFLTCPYCGSAVFLDKSKVVFHWYLRPTLDETEAREALHRWMAGNETVKDLDVKAEVTSSRFEYFPLWMLRVGQGGAETIRLEPAAATSTSELKRMPLPPGDLVRYESSLDPQATAPTVPLETVLGWEADFGIDRDTVAEISLVHVPLFTFQYEFRGQRYVAVVEAISGRVFANIFPAKAEAPYRWIALASAAVFLCLATFPVAGGALSPGQGTGLGVLLCAGLGLIAVPILYAGAVWVAAKV